MNVAPASMIEAQRGWTPDVFGMYGSSEFIFNVFGFLILAGIILDKMGVRFTECSRHP